jgi:hypothetical protein
MNSRLTFTILYICLGFAFSIAGPVSWYGTLQVDGKYIKDKDKLQTVQLKGPSLYWSTFAGAAFYNEEPINWFVDTMDISVIRAAMAIKYWDNRCDDNLDDGDRNYGYLSNSTKWPAATAKANQELLIDNVVQAAILNDIYVIIDWHSHCAHNETSDAGTFFEKMATKYKDIPNVIFEIYNEPPGALQNEGTNKPSKPAITWNQINAYATTIIPKIRNTGNNNLILVGSPNWSSNPNECASSGLKNSYSNIACTLHFYAGTHSGSSSDQLTNANSALNSTVPVFASEWGTVNADGKGGPNQSSSQSWMTWMDNNKVSSCNWAAVNLEEGASIWDNAKYAQSGMSVDALSESGKLLYGYMGGNGKTTLGKTSPPTGYPYGRSTTVTIKEGDSKTWTLAELGASNGETLAGVTQPEIGTVSSSSTGFTYQSLEISAQNRVTFHYTISKGGKNSKHRVTVRIDRPPRVSVTRLNVSSKSATALNFSNLGITSADGKSMTFTAQSLTGDGSIARASDSKSLTYTPAGNAQNNTEVSLAYTVTDGTYSVQKNVTLVLGNMPPTGNGGTRSIPNTAPFTWSLDGTANGANATLGGSDPEGDFITIANVRQVLGDPGTVSISQDKRSFTYTPATGMKSGGRPILYYSLTDGQDVGPEAKITLTITGTGSDIGTITDQPPVVAIGSPQLFGSFGLRMLGKNLLVELSKSGSASLDIYSISGKRVASLMNGNQSTGGYEFNLGNLQKGVYIVRLKQGSELKIQRVVVK